MATVFVYGTLLTGFRNQLRFLPRHAVSRVALGVVSDAWLVHFEAGFPGMYAREGAGGVQGEIVHIKAEHVDEVVRGLDHLEAFYGDGHPDNMYTRTTVTVQDLETGESLSCQTYFCLVDAASAAAVVEGRPASWKEYMEHGALQDADHDWASKHNSPSAAAAAAGDDDGAPSAVAAASGAGAAAAAVATDEDDCAASPADPVAVAAAASGKVVEGGGAGEPCNVERTHVRT